MSQSSPAVASLPPASAAALRKLGGDLAMARKRRRQSLKDWAARLQVSVPTLMRMEKGDPTVSMGVYATALWMINRQEALATAAEPKEDLAALEAEIRQAEQRRSTQGRRRWPKTLTSHGTRSTCGGSGTPPSHVQSASSGWPAEAAQSLFNTPTPGWPRAFP